MGNFVSFLFAYGAQMEEDPPFSILCDYTKISDEISLSSGLDEVLNKIFVHLNLNFPSLTLNRLVNQTWRRLVSSEFLHRNCLVLTFHQYKTSPYFRTPHSHLPLQALNNLLEESANCPLDQPFIFPCTHFQFYGNLMLQDARQFFKLHGSHIKILYIQNLINNFTRWSILHKLLVQAPNIHHLTILGSNFDFDASSTSDNVDMMIVPLPNLKVFRMDYETNLSTLYKILSGASNLQRIENFDWPHIDVLFNCVGRSLEIEILKLIHTSGGSWSENQCHILPNDKLRLILDMANPQQFHPENRWCNSAMSEDLIRILKLSQDTLEQLDILPLGWLELELMPFPPLRKLRQLKISTLGGQPYNIFPSCVMMTQEPKQTFPHLHLVTLELDDYGKEFWSKCFPTEMGMSLVMVKKLVLMKFDQDPIDLETLKYIRDMFPHIKCLKVGCRNQRASLLSAIFKIWNESLLEELEIGTIGISREFQIDAVLTGIDEKDCRHLAESFQLDSKPKWTLVKTVVKFLGSGRASVRSLKALRRFKLVVKNCSDGQVALLAVNRVSYVYGFNFLQNVKVTVESIGCNPKN